MAARPFSITDTLTSDEIKDLCRISSWRAAAALAVTWISIFALFDVAAHWPTWPVLAGVTLLLGGRMLALGTLGHDAAHKVLFKSRRVNDVAGVWLLDAWIWANFFGYRTNHLKHHVVSGTLEDPDLGTVTPYPMARNQLAWAFLKDLVGVTGALRFASNVLYDLGFVRYSAAGDVVPLAQAGRKNRDVLASVVRAWGPAIVCLAIVFAVSVALGHWWLGLLWVGAWASPLQLFIRCRATQEHACVPEPGHPAHGSRTVGAPFWEKLTVAPYNINFHIEHHLLMTVPFYNLPRMHAMLRERGVLDGAPVERDMLATLLHVTGGGAPNAHANPPLGPSGVRPTPEPLPPLTGAFTASAFLPRIGEALARGARRVRGAPPSQLHV